MTTMSNEEFARIVLSKAQSEPFVPTAQYDSDGDCIEFLASPEPFFAERVDDLVTVYYGQDSHEIVGSLLKGVSEFCQQLLQKMPGFKIEVHDGRVRLHHIFRARLWSSVTEEDSMPTLTYKKLMAIAEETCVEAELCCV
ncbi:MAG: hypothetical protein JW818_12455 [Pirellulales bacterium]|nr:hypothetical protein [Pirellulales bacterium]